MEKRRVLIVVAVAICLLCAVAAIRPVEEHGIPISNFWSSKFSNARDYDIVAVGDSRVLHGLSMKPFTELGIGKGYNFGFRGSAATEEYYSAAIEHLSDDGQRILVLGITPNSYTEYAHHSNGFDQRKKEYLGRSPATPHWIGYVEQRLQPMTLGELYRIISGSRNPLQLTYHADGWIESAHEKLDADRLLGFYNVHFENNQALPENVAADFRYLERCIENGIKVFAFRPPLSESVGTAEDKNSGFDYKRFAEGISKIGGVWLEVDPSSFVTYDGSHLTHESAREFSDWLASEIKFEIEKKPGDDKR